MNPSLREAEERRQWAVAVNDSLSDHSVDYL